MKIDKIHIGLAVGNIVFAILSVLFIILFSTKHDSSSAFLLSAQVPSNISFGQFANELKSKLEQKYAVGTFAASALGPLAKFVFSLRGVQDLKDVQTFIASDPVLAASQITDGHNAIDVCDYGRQPITLHPVTATPSKSSSTAPQTTVTVSTTELQKPTNKLWTTAITDAPPNTLAPTYPPETNKYCQGVMKRDVVLLIDTAAPVSSEDKKTALANLGTKLSAGIPFQSGARVAIVDLLNGQSIGEFAANSSSFDDNWEKLLQNSFNTTIGSIDVSLAYGTIGNLLRQSNPMEAILITDHGTTTEPENDVRLRGVFVSAVLPTKLVLPLVDKLTTVSKAYTNWTDMAAQDPFATLFCQYNDGTVMVNNARISSSAAADGDTPKCQKLDVIVVFDTSQSVVEEFVRQYVQFSINFIQQYTLSGAPDGDNTRVGVIQFNSTAKNVLQLGEHSLDDFKTAVNGIHYTGGTTNTLAAMQAGLEMFKEDYISAHGRAMVFLSDGQPYPLNADTWSHIESVGNELKTMGVDIFFVGDENGYDVDTRKILSNITGNSNWVFSHISDASINLPSDLLEQFPCPPRVCEMAYYAVEISEILTEENKIQSLKFILQVAQNVYNQKNSTHFQLMVYNDHQYLLPKNGNYSFAEFKSTVTKLIQDGEYRQSLSSGHTRIDTAINVLANDMVTQQKRRPYFQSSVLFAGQANSGVLDPINDEKGQKQDLTQAAKYISSVCSLVYALDDSNSNTAIYGDDLWDIVVPKTRTIRISSENLEKDLEATDYYQQVQALECRLPDLATCALNFIDLGVAFDLTGPMTDNVIDYVKTMLGQFDTLYTAHISMYGYGGGKQPRILASLSTHQNMTDGFDNLTHWQLGLPFGTTTMSPTTSAKRDETELLVEDDNIPINSADIDGLFKLIHSQFGCGSYSDDADRIPVKNVILVVSDNFGSYTNVWDIFATEADSGWKCDDCPGTPAYVFLSSNKDTAPVTLGATYNINDFDLTSSMKAVNYFNSIVNGICTMPLRNCCTYKVPNTCQRTKEFWQGS